MPRPRRKQSNLGAAFAAARLRKGLTQVELAKRLHVNQTTLSNWEVGRTIPPWDTIVSVSKALGIDLTSLAKEELRIIAASVSEPEPSYIYNDTGASAAKLPIYSLGHIAGTTDAEGVQDGEIEVTAEQRKLADCVIRVLGKSMSPYLQEVDLVGIKRQQTARPNQIVLARADGDLTLKRLLKITQGWIYLQPLNPEFDVIISREVAILGVFRWLLRLRPEGKL